MYSAISRQRLGRIWTTAGLGRSSLSSNRFRFSPPPPHSYSRIPAYLWIPAVGLFGSSVYTYYAFQEEVPLTKRKRWICTSPQMEWQLGEQQYQQMIQKQFKREDILPPSHRASITVQRVGKRLVAASNKFMKEHGLEHVVSKSPYTYTVVRSDMANAFVLPNNHVFVLTGLFRYVQDEDELAAVLGHELAHNLARHVGEKVSENMVVTLLAPITLMIDPTGVLTMFLSNAVTLLRDLPHSREQEMEADQIGVYLAAEACYDPRAAKRVFAAMQEQANSSKSISPPEFLSTHPSHTHRISNFDKWMPDAMNTFEADLGSKCRHVRREMAEARKSAALQAAQREQELQQQRPLSSAAQMQQSRWP